jgi:threonine/homoserine/homoserine lactone efflux protein
MSMNEALGGSLWTFALTALVIEITPGPNMGYLAVLSLSRGWQAGAAAVIGVALGHAVYGVLAAFGVAALIDASPVVYETLRWAGVAYMAWLAWETWSSETEISPDVTAVGTRSDASAAFQRGLITNLLNPKAAIFFIAVVPTFVTPGGSVVGQTLLLSGIFVAIATAVHSAIVVLASRLQNFATNEHRRKPVRRALALLLVCIAIWLAYSTTR